jgi:transposase
MASCSDDGAGESVKSRRGGSIPRASPTADPRHKVVVIWDGASIHRSEAVKRFLEDGATARIRLEQLPGYAPDLNPDEGIWKHLKCVELKNVCCRNLKELRSELRKAKERLRHKRDVILGCIRQPGFEV